MLRTARGDGNARDGGRGNEVDGKKANEVDGPPGVGGGVDVYHCRRRQDAVSDLVMFMVTCVVPRGEKWLVQTPTRFIIDIRYNLPSIAQTPCVSKK